MATYVQWRAGGSKVKRVTYLSAANWVLAEEVVADIRCRFAPANTCYAGEQSDREVWEALTLIPLEREPRLIVVRNAERIRDWSLLPLLLSSGYTMPGATTLFVSAESEYPPDEGHGALMRKSTGAILIKATVPIGDELTAWAARQLPEASQDYAADVLMLCGDDLAAARDLARAISVLPDVTRKQLALIAVRPAAEFAQSVIAGDRKTALSVAPLLSPDQVAFAIGTLDKQLDDLTVVAPAAARKLSLREIAALGVKEWAALQVLPHVARYNPQVIRKDRGVLLTAADTLRSGESEGVAEFIASLW